MHPSGCLDSGYDNRNLNRSPLIHLGQESIIYFPLLIAKSMNFIWNEEENAGIIDLS